MAESNPEMEINTVVSNPQKEQDGSKAAFISYLIITETNNPMFQAPVVRVRRRYSDFVWLYNTLVNDFPACAVPPLPDKKRLEYIKGDRFGVEFTAKRCSSLNRFLKRLSLHPLLRRTRPFLVFLESPDWNTYVKSRSTGMATTAGGAGVGASSLSESAGAGSSSSSTAAAASSDTVSDSPAAMSDQQRQQQQQLGNGVLDGFGDALVNVFSKVNKPNPQFEDIRDGVIKMEDDLSHIEKLVARVIRRENELEQDFVDFAGQITKLSQLESNLADPFNVFADGVLNDATCLRNLYEFLDTDYITSLRDMESYIGAIKHLLKQREQKQMDHEALVGYLSKASQDRDVLSHGGGSNFLRNKVEDIRGVNHEQARQERLRKLDSKVDNLVKAVDETQTISTAFDDAVLREMQDFQVIKAAETKQNFKGLTTSHIGYFRSCLDTWQEVLKDLETPNESNSKSPTNPVQQNNSGDDQGENISETPVTTS